MRANRSRDTGPEMALRRALHAQGLRYRLNARPLPQIRRTADIVFRSKRVAVFVDGCFWHGCPEHYRAPKANAQYWSAKVNRNVARDIQVDEILRDAGWVSVRVWEHEAIPSAVQKVTDALTDCSGSQEGR
ncbi:very short patch repair endonuclease [Nocardioides hwasunensis]|uniref:Very short patch repair endonuclease n=2 Tax=Nocardioides hwasunensis TaxID=397258 RepID=A0ABR8MIR2_9ACTN|nr:very short patch repair endonuclease [Nocardioides hwasunensis]